MTAPVSQDDYIEVGKDSTDTWRWNRMSVFGDVLQAGGEAFKTRREAIAAALELHPNLEIRKVDEAH